MKSQRIGNVSNSYQVIETLMHYKLTMERLSGLATTTHCILKVKDSSPRFAGRGSLVIARSAAEFINSVHTLSKPYQCPDHTCRYNHVRLLTSESVHNTGHYDSKPEKGFGIEKSALPLLPDPLGYDRHHRLSTRQNSRGGGEPYGTHNAA